MEMVIAGRGFEFNGSMKFINGLSYPPVFPGLFGGFSQSFA
jgi:hypothetical protein